VGNRFVLNPTGSLPHQLAAQAWLFLAAQALELPYRSIK
jgi:hypothetical protein